MKRVFAIIISLFLLTADAGAVPIPEELSGVLPQGLAESAERYGILDGGMAWLSDAFRGAAADAARDSVRNAALLILVALICGAAEGIAESAGEIALRCVPYCGVLAASLLAVGDLRALLGMGADTVAELGVLAKLLLPVTASAMAAGGLVSTAGVWQVTTLLVCDLMTDAAALVLLPLAYCTAAAAAAGALLGDDRLNLLAEGLEKLSTGAIKLSVMAFTAYLSVTGVLTGSADRAAVKAAQTMLSGTIPVVGGILSDAAESVLAASVTLRGTIGALGVFAIAAVCLAPLVRLGVQFMFYRFAAFAAGLVGTKELSGFLDRLGGVFALIFAMTAASALMLLVSLLIATAMVSG